MSSSEEYLDSLLRSLTENTADNSAELPESAPLDNAAGTNMEEQVPSEDIPGEDTSDMADMDDIAAMFASVGEGSPEDETADDSLSLDELSFDDMPADEPMTEGSLSGEMEPAEDMLDVDPALTEFLNESGISDEVLDEDMHLDETPDEDMFSDAAPDDSLSFDDLLSNDLSSDDLSLDDLEPESLSFDDLSLDESMLPEEEAPDEELFSGNDEAASGDEAIPADGDEAFADDFALEELLGGSGASGDIDSGEAEAGDEDHFALEETGEEDADLSALLASMGGDEDLSAISDMLEKSDQGVAVDDDMMALLGEGDSGESDGGEMNDAFDFFSGEEEEPEQGAGGRMEEGEPENIREITPGELEEREKLKTRKQKKQEEKERRKKEKRAKKNAAKSAASDSDGLEDELAALVEGADTADKEPKKQGLLARLMALLLEEDESGADESDLDNLGPDIGNLSDENKELLEELQAEDKKNAKKKEKKEKKGRKEKGKKGGKNTPETGNGEGEEDGESEDKAQKPRKEKKKKKKEKAVEETPKAPEKKLSKKKVISVFVFCATIAACIIVITILLPVQMEKQEARVAFDRDQYAQAYELLYGKNLSKEDEALLQKSSIILQMQRKMDSYENYSKLDMPLEALNALLDGVSRYQDLRDKADRYNVSDEVRAIYEQILDALAGDYGLSETDAMDIISSGDDVTYSQRVQAVIAGEAYGTESETPEAKQDILPEEEEIIDRLENTETE